MIPPAATHESAPRRAPRLGIALGGGAELGLAHIGVLEVLEAHGYSVACIAGSSAGALVSGFYAAGSPLPEMERIALRLTWKTIQRVTLPILALSTNEPLRRFLQITLPAKSFDDLRMPLRLVTTDLLTAEMVVYEGGPGLRSTGLIRDPDIVFERGDLVEAIRASCTQPVINRPVPMGARLLVDGCLSNNVPSALVKDMGADLVVGVDLISWNRRGPRPTNIFAYAMQSQAINLHWALKSRHSAADVLIRPDFSALRETGFDQAGAILQMGKQAAEQALPRLEEAIAAWREGVSKKVTP